MDMESREKMMKNPVMIMITDKPTKASLLCNALLWAKITFLYESTGVLYAVTVAESDVRKATEKMPVGWRAKIPFGEINA
jgi:hypothetical protein